MTRVTALRLALVAGLAAVAAAAAHGGGTLLSDPRWLAAGALGALITASAACLGWRTIVQIGSAPQVLPLPLLVAWLVATQLGAHLGLLTAGAPAHTDALGSLALHVLLALCVALLVRSLERCAARLLLCGGAPHEARQAQVHRSPAVSRPSAVPERRTAGRAPPNPA